MTNILAFILSALFLSSTALAEIQITESEAGIFITNGAASAKAKEHNEPIERTHRIPNKIGTKFGVRFKASGLKGFRNTVKHIHLMPTIIDSKGKHWDKIEERKDLPEDEAHHVIAYVIEDPYEQITGTWTMMVFEGDRLLVKETFELVAE